MADNMQAGLVKYTDKEEVLLLLDETKRTRAKETLEILRTTYDTEFGFFASNFFHVKPHEFENLAKEKIAVLADLTRDAVRRSARKTSVAFGAASVAVLSSVTLGITGVFSFLQPLFILFGLLGTIVTIIALTCALENNAPNELTYGREKRFLKLCKRIRELELLTASTETHPKQTEETE